MVQHVSDNCNLQASLEDLAADRAYTFLATIWEEDYIRNKITA